MVVKHSCTWSLTAVKIVKVYTCDVCHKQEQRNSTALSLSSAVIQTLAGCGRGIFRCSGCRQSFGQKASLLVHKRRHSKSKPYVCVKCNLRFVTRAGLQIHKTRHKLRQVTGSVQCPEQSQMCIVSKSQNVVSHILKIEIGDKTKRVLVITNNSTVKDNSSGMFGEKPADSDKISSVIPRILAPKSYSTKNDVHVDTPNHIFAPIPWLINDGKSIENQQTAGIKITSPCVNEVIKVSSEHTSDSRAIIDDCISNHWWIKKKTPGECDKKPFSQSEYKTSANFDDTVDNDEQSDSLSNITITEKTLQSADLCVANSKIEQEQKENEMGSNCNNVHDRRPRPRMKTKSCLQNESPAKVSITRMVTRSLGKKVLPKTKSCTNLHSIQGIPEISPKRKVPIPEIIPKKKSIPKMTYRSEMGVPESTIVRKIVPSKKKTMIVAGLEEDAYNIEADSDIKSLLKKDGVEKVLYFKCSMCPVKHLSEQDLANHEKLHFAKKIKLHQCEICKKMCNDSTKLEDHRRLHTGEKPFVCKTCNKSFRMKPCLNIHMRVHTKEKLYRCSICSKEFTYRNTMNRHLARHQPNPYPGRKSTKDEQIKCENCDKRFRNTVSLQAHNKKARKCDVCSQVFCSFSDLVRHKNKNHVDAFSVSKSDETYCQFCKKTFKSNYFLLIHMQKHMQKGMPVTFPCPKCSESFDNYDLLRIHKKTHTVKREKCIACPWSHCGKMLTSQTRLNSHLKRHNGETLYLCHRCGMHFTDCVFYLKHRRACYQRITTYKCTMCGRVLSGYSALQKHIMSHTGERPYQCEVCGSRFIDNTHLKRHKRIHVRRGEMPPFENVCTSETVTVESVLCLSDDAQPQDYTDYATCLDIGNEQVVAYCVDEQNGNMTNEQTLLQAELLRATENVAKETE